MASTHRHRLALVSALIGLTAHACWPSSFERDGRCEVDSLAVLDCRAAGYSGELMPSGLVGHLCTGSERPDLDATYLEGVPQGLVCSDRGATADGRMGFCCTAVPEPCAYDPSAQCDAGSHGYQCRGANRPESLNPMLHCTNGVREAGGELIEYCCTDQLATPDCQQQDALGCSPRQLGFLCRGDSLPRGEQLGANKSRADFFHPLCSVPQVAANPAYRIYCCYMPALVPIGGTCVQHIGVPGCAPGRFGFACYGPDTPEENYLPMSCPERGSPGVSAEGYPATLFCCDFE